MQAALDIGNTFGKLGIFQDSKLVSFHKGKIAELIAILKENSISEIIVCSVTYSLNELKELFKEFSQTLFLTKDTKIPIKNLYGTKETLGYDRLAAAIGAFGRFANQNNLIIDLGTAVKYDFISDQNEFLGGMIGPGKKMRFKALHAFTKKLPLLESNEFPELIGGSTQDCIKSGVVNGMLAEINGVIDFYQKKMPLNVILTGGDANFFETRIKTPYFTFPYLVLEGLIRIYNYNA